MSMSVADLQQYLADLARLLEAGGARGVAADLAAIRDGLAPFRGLTLRKFAEFLVRAEAFSRGEVPPATLRRGRGGAKTAGSKKATADPAALGREVQGLFERAADPAVTAEQIEAAVGRLGGLTKDVLVAVAEAIGLQGMRSKKKDDIQAAIRHRLLARKGTSVRTGLIDRPAPPPVATLIGPPTPGRAAIGYPQAPGG
jgi:hypothetical protein